MSHRVTLTLVGVLLAASLLAWFDPRTRETFRSGASVQPAASHERALKPLLEFVPREVEEIRVQYGGRKLRTRRESTGWSGAERPERVDEFLSGLREMVEIMTLQASSDEFGDFGLDPSAGTIELELRDASTIELFVGDPNPAGTSTYARIAGSDSVVLTGALLRWELEKLARVLSEDQQ